MDSLILFSLLGLIVFVVGVVLGYWLASHIHTVAANAAAAVTRATTVPSGDVAALNSAVKGLGDALNNVTVTVGSKVNAEVAKGVAATPQA